MKRAALISIFLLPLAGAIVGLAAAPSMARAHPRVRLAGRIHLEDSQRITELTVESEAFRETGVPTEGLFADARRVERRFRAGTALLGAWIGLVVALKLTAAAWPGARRIYEIDAATCVVCSRCFSSCPRERERQAQIARKEGETQ